MDTRGRCLCLLQACKIGSKVQRIYMLFNYPSPIVGRKRARFYGPLSVSITLLLTQTAQASFTRHQIAE